MAVVDPQTAHVPRARQSTAAIDADERRRGGWVANASAVGGKDQASGWRQFGGPDLSLHGRAELARPVVSPDSPGADLETCNAGGRRPAAWDACGVADRRLPGCVRCVDHMP